MSNLRINKIENRSFQIPFKMIPLLHFGEAQGKSPLKP